MKSQSLHQQNVNSVVQDHLKERHLFGFLDVHRKVIQVEAHQSEGIRFLGTKEVSLIDKPIIIVMGCG